LKIALCIATLVVVIQAATGQGTSSLLDTPHPTIKSTSMLVIVPTLVRSHSGQLVAGLSGSDFRLTDNGIEQKVQLAQAESEPLAMVVLMQTGGVASSWFPIYSKLDSAIEDLLGGSMHNVALVTFGSRPDQIWAFPPSSDALYYFLTHPKGGDEGAAIMDAVKCAIDLLQEQPSNFRRIILLLSQAKDAGSRTRGEDLLRKLAESGTTIHSLTFSPEKVQNWRSAKSSREKRVAQAAPDDDKSAHPPSIGIALKTMRENTASTLAELSGGQRVIFRDEQDLESKLLTLSYEIRNGYTLSFSPSSRQPGLHNIKVQVLNELTPFEVTARKTYWIVGTGD
jgi:VWFA-related protein